MARPIIPLVNPSAPPFESTLEDNQKSLVYGRVKKHQNEEIRERQSPPPPPYSSIV